jgi:hypothetical protein
MVVGAKLQGDRSRATAQIWLAGINYAAERVPYLQQRSNLLVYLCEVLNPAWFEGHGTVLAVLLVSHCHVFSRGQAAVAYACMWSYTGGPSSGSAYLRLGLTAWVHTYTNVLPPRVQRSHELGPGCVNTSTSAVAVHAKPGVAICLVGMPACVAPSPVHELVLYKQECW